MKKIIFASLTACILLLFNPMAVFADSAVPRFEPAECPFPLSGNKIECGYLVVPEDRADPASPAIRLPIAIFRALSPDPAPDPLVYLEGGPGASTLQMAAGWAADTPFRHNRDLILIEQRGNRYAEPWLDCPEIDQAIIQDIQRALPIADEIKNEVAAGQLCRDRLRARGIHLAAYTSAASAADLADLRRALGYDQWNIISVSYGTRLALTTLRDQPAGLRSVILDSVFPPQASDEIDNPARAERVFNKLFADCAADPACQAKYPQLREHLLALIDRADQNPIRLSSANPLNGQTIQLLFTGRDLLKTLFTGMYSTSVSSLVPVMIEEAYRGNSAALAAPIDQTLMISSYVSKGIYLSITCYEEDPFNTPEMIQAAKQKVTPQFREALTIPMEICQVWDRKTSDPRENQPVYSDIPTLVLAGEYDPITPPEDARLAASTLSHSYFYEFPGLAHGVTFDHDCPRQMAQDFVNHPQQAPNASCLKDIKHLPIITDIFVTPAIYRLYNLLNGPQSLGLAVGTGFCLLFFLADILFGLLRLVKRGVKTENRDRLVQGLSWLTSLLNLVFFAGLVRALLEALASNPLILSIGLPGNAAWLAMVLAISTLGAIGMAVSAIWAWSGRRWNTVLRVHYTLTTASALVFCGFLLLSKFINL